MKTAFKALALGVAIAASVTIAKADQITGGENVTGSVTFNPGAGTIYFPTPNGSTVTYTYQGPSDNLPTNDFYTSGLVSSPLNCTTPSACWLLIGQTVPLGTQSTDGNHLVFNTPTPDPLPVFTLTEGGVTTTFSLTSEAWFDTTSTYDGATYYDVTLDGTGIFTLTGYDPTPGTFNFTINQNTGQIVGSFSGVGYTSPGPVPEPSSLALLGTGLLGAAAFARRRFLGRFSA